MNRVAVGTPEDIRLAIHVCAGSAADTALIRRLVALLMVSEGLSCREVGEKFGESGRTIQRWADRFRNGGSAALSDRSGGGRPSFLDTELWARLKADFSLRPSSFGYVPPPGTASNAGVRRPRDVWTVLRLAEHLQCRYGVQVSLRQYQRFFRRLEQEQRKALNR